MWLHQRKDAIATPPACGYPHRLRETKPNCAVDTKPRNAGTADECQSFHAMKCIIPRDHHAAASRGHTLPSSRPHPQRTRSVKGLAYVSHNSSAANPTDLCHHLTHTCIAATVGVRAACFESERVEQRPVRPSSQYRRGISKPTGEPLSIRDECIRPSGPACAASNIVRVPRSSHTIAAPLSVTRAARHQRPKHPAAESSASRPN